MDKIVSRCLVCQSLATNRCSRCRIAMYCGTVCQRKDYLQHKIGCKTGEQSVTKGISGEVWADFPPARAAFAAIQDRGRKIAPRAKLNAFGLLLANEEERLLFSHISLQGDERVYFVFASYNKMMGRGWPSDRIVLLREVKQGTGMTARYTMAVTAAEEKEKPDEQVRAVMDLITDDFFEEELPRTRRCLLFRPMGRRFYQVVAI